MQTKHFSWTRIGTIGMLVLALLLIVSLCGLLAYYSFDFKGAAQTQTDMHNLALKVVTTYRGQVEISMESRNNVAGSGENSNTLSATLENVEYNTLSDTEQKAKAEEVGRFIKKSYQGTAQINHICIAFTEEQQKVIVDSRQSRSYCFAVNDL